jgi:hypothetical protein
MNTFRQAAPKLLPWLITVFPLVFWAMLVLSLQAGNVKDIFRPGSPGVFIQGLRAILPFLAGVSAAVLILAKLSRHRQGGLSLFGPLGLTAAYGLVGVASALLSPKGSLALYWAAAYLSVPLVLWAIIWGNDVLESAWRIAYLNWVIIILAVAVLFVAALLYLNLGALMLSPNDWFSCRLYSSYRGDSWLDLTSGALRPTGVGRYAAIAAVVALGGLWQGRWRYLWGVVLVAAGVLLLSSGARTSFIGVAAAAPLVILLQGGKRAALVGLVGLALLVPLVWGTGIHRDFLENCLRVSNTPVSSPGPVALGTPPAEPSRTWSFNSSGRTALWGAGWDLIKQSPFLGWGFHADRLLLGTHMHNALLHALIQTGLIGTVPFVSALVWAWVLQIKALRNRAQLPVVHRHLVIQVAGVLAFLSLRAIAESTGAFFGVDWLLLAPLLLYLQVVNQTRYQSLRAA